MSKLLMKLIETLGPSGYEEAVRKLVYKNIKPYVDEIHIDKFGNLIAHKKGKGDKVVLAAHMDEIGLMVKEINQKGQIFVSTIGGVETITLPGQKVDVITSNGSIHGVLSFAELSGDELIEEIPEIEDVFVDTGLNQKQLKRLGVEVGDYIVPKHAATYLGSKDIICGKALDDRIGCYILLELAKRIKETKLDLYFVFTVQEEIGLYGAQTSLYRIDPDWGIAVDVLSFEDIEDEKKKCGTGFGPTLVVKDSEMISNHCLNEHIKKIAKKKKIPLQLKVEEYGTTDASKIMIHKGGMPATVVGVAIRNIHSTISIAHMNDIKLAIDLLEDVLKKPPKICLV